MKTFVLALLITLLAACTSPAERAAPTGAAQLANPASVYCQQLGGKLEIVKGKDGGESGYCTLPGGERIEEWALFRRDHK
ncbi:putative hemolysin [Dyella sp. 2RAB6]|uniref:putative hemolysin n=1 Tax=Dyella sp. 2RAB6 TaxID=3232992 RepID=UPI003F90A72D